jgi:hypothetical protein
MFWCSSPAIKPDVLQLFRAQLVTLTGEKGNASLAAPLIQGGVQAAAI